MRTPITWLSFLVLLGALPVAEAQVINAASCSATDVQTAFNSVTSSTTTVNIPTCPGGVAWAVGVTLKIPSGNTSLTVIGAGSQSVTGGGDQTVIIDNVSHSPSDNPTLAITTGSASSFFRLSGITFATNGGSSVSYNGVVTLNGNSASVRVDHAHLNLPIEGAEMVVGGCVYGVMDHSIVELPVGGTGGQVREIQGSCGGDSLSVGNGQWNQATALARAPRSIWKTTFSMGGLILALAGRLLYRL